MDIKFYFLIFLRRLPYFTILVALGTAVGLFVALSLPPVYVAQALLVVESEQIPDELAASTVRTDASEQLQIIQQRIFARNRLLEMANRLDIYRGAGAPDSPMTPDETLEDLRKRANIRTTGGSRARGQSTATVVTVSFDAPTPRMAAEVANELVTLILQENVQMRTTVSGQTLEFFNQKVEELGLQLAQASSEIQRFQEANLEALPDSLDFRRSQQAAEQERLLELERTENQLRDRRNRLVALFEQTGEVGLIDNNARTIEEAQLQDLKNQLSTATAVLSPDNPRVTVLQAQIVALERTVAAQRSLSGRSGVNADGTELTPFEIQLADLDGQLSFISEAKLQIEENLRELADSIAQTPANALTLGQLERNFANLRAQYDQAISNQATAEVGDTIEALSKGQRISVIEQAIAPSKPIKPNRRRIAAMGVAAGLAMGAGFIVLLELLNTAVRRPVDIVNGLQITPIITVPYIRTAGQIWRRRLIIMFGILLVSVGLPAALWYVDTNIRPLQPIIESLLQRAGIT
jgi:uncharacterized protein involved in exopolysaccharide biosynthesis